MTLPLSKSRFLFAGIFIVLLAAIAPQVALADDPRITAVTITPDFVDANNSANFEIGFTTVGLDSGNTISFGFSDDDGPSTAVDFGEAEYQSDLGAQAKYLASTFGDGDTGF